MFVENSVVDPIREPTPTISTAWVALKSTHCRKLQPILEYSLHTRVSKV